MSDPQAFEPVIGLEVHAQLLTESKAFCACSTAQGASPNTHICPVCLGLPGALPRLNGKLVEFAVRMGIATRSVIATRTLFARKHYVYPDLPKGYQISQLETPICAGGSVEIDLDDGSRKPIGITRIHMEEDAAKLLHDGGTSIDFNRCGVPLLEIVSEPDLRSANEASRFLQKIRQIVTYLGICDGNMEKGSLRCDANVSVRRRGEQRFGTKTELKNMNSFRNVERALEYEIHRQAGMLSRGETVAPETLLWDAGRNAAVPMRAKEQSHDYRYFPEPDLLPVVIEESWRSTAEAAAVEHPTARRDRFMETYGLSRYDADLLTSDKSYADYFEEVVRSLGDTGTVKQAANWVMNEALHIVAERQVPISAFPVSPARLAALIRLIADGTMSGKSAKGVFTEMLSTDEDAASIVRRNNLAQLSDAAVIEQVVAAVLSQSTVQVEKYRSGNNKLFAYFVGEVMKATNGKANPSVVTAILAKKLPKRDPA